jgi:hypothetical protein
MFLGSLSVSSRRVMVTVGLGLALCAASTLRAQQPAAGGQDAPDPLKLTGDFVLLVNQVKADKAADFEGAWATIKDKLSKSEKPELKELGESLKIFKLGTPPAPGAPVVYIFRLEPPSKTQSYDPTKILYYSGAFPDRAEADAIYAKIKDAYVGIQPWPLVKIGG